eukprot:CAMPEP_0184969722 /NCGR_PEP_ID=MMETSP1098-20130426/2413_1 /TAXON_ID=89044 /ORGANISM="Spumella elongata, Strain CCAP 955/1" /LENGTH=611 /DNA_ID=CAMNT_0027491533 /DNA_START=1 /DNA_END=1836 /DNA_ORIENTATION=+
MEMTKLLLALVLCAGTVSGFFDFLKSSPKPVEQHIDTNLVRGAPEYLHAKYTLDPFVCDNGKAHRLTVINDGFCDCVDKSDEPGTSACQGTVFHCINKGYKTVKIPSSRVDDQVCDCCDGSDEGRVANCPNMCDEVAASERAQLAKVTSDYKIGSAIRANLIQTVRAEKAALTASVTPLGMEVHNLQQAADELSAQIETANEQVTLLESTVAHAQRKLVRHELQVEALNFASLSQLLSNLLKVLKIEGSSVKRLAEDIASPASEDADASTTSRRASVSSENEGEHIEGDADADADVGDRLHDEDEYGDVAEQQQDIDLDAQQETVAVPADAEAPTCEVVSLSSDVALLPLCDSVTNAETALEALVKIVIKKNAYKEVSLLLAHHHAHGPSTDSHEFVRQHLDSELSNTCPASFETEPAQKLCSVRESLPVEVSALDAQLGLTEARTRLQTLRTEASENRNKLNEVERKLKTAQGANDELLQHADELEYLAMKDQCFDKEDGAFTYSLCILGAITQKEVVGHRSVTLGTHEGIELTGDNAAPVNGVVPSAVLKYGNGQHCHAFGARTATVTVSCAPQNALISATEPSTCAYRLHFESPAACSPKYAQLAGIA